MSSEPFADYEAAVERASWVRKGAVKVLFGRSGAGKGALGWESCTVELEQTGTNQNEVDFGTLSIFGTQKKHLKVLLLVFNVFKDCFNQSLYFGYGKPRTFWLLLILSF